MIWLKDKLEWIYILLLLFVGYFCIMLLYGCYFLMGESVHSKTLTINGKNTSPHDSLNECRAYIRDSIKHIFGVGGK